MRSRNGEKDRAQRGGRVFATTREKIDMARRERRSGNLPQVSLWRALRTRPAGFQFRREHQIGRSSLDFAYLKAHLAIEVDGQVHEGSDRPARDAEREPRGFQVLRIPERTDLTDLDGAVRAVVASRVAGASLHRPTGGPPPRLEEVSGPDETP